MKFSARDCSNGMQFLFEDLCKRSLAHGESNGRCNDHPHTLHLRICAKIKENVFYWSHRRHNFTSFMKQSWPEHEQGRECAPMSDDGIDVLQDDTDHSTKLFINSGICRCTYSVSVQNWQANTIRTAKGLCKSRMGRIVQKSFDWCMAYAPGVIRTVGKINGTIRSKKRRQLWTLA